jgi:uncharacterized protein
MRLPTKKFLFWKKILIPEAISIIRFGIDSGINYLDTAWGYHGGKSEIVVGQALQDGYRDKVMLSTKLPMWRIKKVEDFDYHLKTQLDKLQTDHLDVYLFHGLNKKRFETLKELNLIKKMEEARDSGLIKYIGFSFHDNWPVFKDIIDFYPWDVTQIQYNYMDTGIQATTQGLEYATEKEVGVIIMEPIKGGKLANPPADIKKIMEKATNKRTPVDWALQFLWNRADVPLLLSGMGSKKMVVENLASADNSGIGILNSDDQQILSEVAEYFKKLTLVPCTNCEYCMPCSFGVNIPRNFSIINQYYESKNKKRAFKEYNKLASTKGNLNEAKNNGNASLCTKCGKCVELCPQKIDIPGDIEKINNIMANGKNFQSEFGK